MNIRPKIFALAAIFLGAGILMTCFLPPIALVVVTAATIIIIGLLCFRC